MFEELNQEIVNAKDNLRKKQKYESMVSNTRLSLQNEIDRKSELSIILQDELEDVKKLESLSITGLFYSILGSKEKQLEKERQEFLSAKLKFDECCNSISVLEGELASYEETLMSVSRADFEYKSAMKRKEDLILKSNDNNAHKLNQLFDKIADLEVMKNELREAISAGETALNRLNYVAKSLESAETWGSWDMLGGGFIATSAKHSHIDEAKEHAMNSKIELRRFQRELSDVDLTFDIEIDIGSFETFADYFFDGIISDWVVQEKICRSLESVSHVIDKVYDVVYALKKKYSCIENDLISIQQEIKNLVESA